MKRAIYHTLALSIAMLLTVTLVASAEPEAARGGLDIGSLMASAREHYDLSRMDAVLLLEDATVEMKGDGTRLTTIHRIAWMGTEIGLDTYADLRVAHNTATSTLEVKALRTWRDGLWWPNDSEISETAVVATTPYALSSAFDYTDVRETMLLHDGVELPCIVETVYTITERRDAALGSDALWVFPKADPAVHTRLTVAVPEGTTLNHASGNGAPGPERTTADGTDRYVWSADLMDRLPRPLTSAPERHSPYVAWSTWDSWETLGGAFTSAVEEASALNEALEDSVASLMKGRPFAFARAEAVVGFIGETTRGVGYDSSMWEFAPRTAVRTWDTAYGHRLDRTALAAALFREAGLEVVPVFVGRGTGAVDEDVPTLARFEGPFLHLTGDGLDGVYDPSSNALHHGRGMMVGRAPWAPGSGDTPAHPVPTEEPGALDVVVTLERDEDGAWTGTGLLSTAGALSAYESVVGLDGESGGHLSRVSRAFVTDAALDEHSVSRLTQDAVTAGFSFTFEAPEPDDNDRMRFEVGDPPGGVMSVLPSDVHLYVGERDSPLALPSPLSQTVTLTVNADDIEVVRLPEEVALENAMGSFLLSVAEEDDGTFTVTRELTLTGGGPGPEAGPMAVVPGDWPALRALLLEETDERNRVVLLK